MVFAELQTRGLPLEDNVRTENKGLAVERIFSSQIKQSEAFIAFRVKSLAAINLENLALSSIFPSGFEISNERPSDENYDYMDIRDDRVNWFFSLNPGQTKEFSVQVHPSFAGEFRWPGLVLEAMYNPDYFARISGQRVAVR